MALLAVVTGAGLLYVKVVRGWKLGDLMYVTKASLQHSIGAVSSGGLACSSDRQCLGRQPHVSLQAGMEALRSFVATHVPFLQRRIDELDDKQASAATLAGWAAIHLHRAPSAGG